MYNGDNIGIISNSRWGTTTAAYRWRIYQGSTLTIGLPKNKTMLIYMSETLNTSASLGDPSGTCIKGFYPYKLGNGYPYDLFILVQTTDTDYSFSVYGYSPAGDSAYAIVFDLS